MLCYGVDTGLILVMETERGWIVLRQSFIVRVVCNKRTKHWWPI